MGPARIGSIRGLLGILAILAVVAATAFGLPLLDRSLPSSRPVAAATPYPVGGGVTLYPPPGAQLDLTRTRPGAHQGTALFLLAGARLAVVVTPYRSSVAAAAENFREKIERVDGSQVDGGAQVRTAQGVTGVQGTYVTAGRFGVYAVFVSEGVSVEVTASGSDVGLAGHEADVRAAIRSIAFGGAR